MQGSFLGIHHKTRLESIMNRGTCPRDRRRVPDDDVEIGLTQGYNDEPSLEPLKNLVKKVVTEKEKT